MIHSSPIPDKWTGVHLPGVRLDIAPSIERFRKLAANLKATVIIQHDARDIGKLPAFPAAAR